MISFIKKYFTFNKRERNGFILLASAIFFLIVTNIYFKSRSVPISISFQPLIVSETQKPVLTESLPKEKALSDNAIQKNEAPGLFTFNPNSISEEEAIQLGMSKKTAGTLIKYRSKGGKFKTKEDLKKLYGISDKLYVKLESYISINEETKKLKDSAMVFKEKTARTISIVDINSADSLQLVSLNGIGPALTHRILILRNMLGGFYSTEQLKEVYGMKDTLFNLFSSRIKADVSQIKKINVNTASIDEMKKHSYIKFVVAQSIVNYRNKHGKFLKAEDLMSVGSISEENLKKLKPYLEF
ncbi:MAG: helix-hairpin-helix domain-containing protein [Bacteroidia bacterium]|nr:helix-hairpin-helix domain-containing protein [Bacteroidia bacterium]